MLYSVVFLDLWTGSWSSKIPKVCSRNALIKSDYRYHSGITNLTISSNVFLFCFYYMQSNTNHLVPSVLVKIVMRIGL
jgi:hypothetical protein